MSIFRFISALAISALAINASAAPISFDLLAGQTINTTSMTRNYSVGGIGLTITGWSNTTGGAVAQDVVGAYSPGIGVENNTNGHTVDSANNDFDMLLLSFSQAVKLTNIDLGYLINGSASSDVSILSGTSALSAGASWASLLTAGNGWTLAGNYNNVGTSEFAVNAAGLTSKYWLIGAYNPILGPIPNNDSTAEGFKLQSVKVSQVPESSSIALFCLGLLGLVAVRRRQA